MEAERGERILVTGGHGFIGSAVVRGLLARGHRVRCLLRPSSKTQRIDGLEVERVTGDILDPDSLAAAMQGATACIHLAGISAYADMDRDFAWPTIVEGTRNVLQAALAARLRRVVYTSSAVIYGSRDPSRISDEDSPPTLHNTGLTYIDAKLETERIVDGFVAQGLDVVVAIPTETYGPHDDAFLTTGYLKEAINGWPALATHGGTMFGHVEDVAEGILLALERGRPGARYILGSENARLRDIIAQTLEIAGRKKPILVLPTALTLALLRVLLALRLPSPEHPNAVAYGSLFYFVRNDRARQELGWTPRSGRAVLEDTVRWLREAGHIRP